jgi:S1-C subfamily serine protease
MRPATHSIALTLLGFTAGAIVVFGLDRLPSIQAAPEPAMRDRAAPPAKTKPGLTATGFADAVAKAAPAVVKVSGSASSHNHPAQHRGRLGSGVVIAPSGLIVTNSHVVRDLTHIEVELADGRRTTAELIGIDAATDLALLQVSLPGLPAIELGNPAALRSGDVVLAIGHPYGIGQAVSLGIVSGTRRSQLGLTTVEDFIQTDAAINPGSSGGALVDSDGRLVGIATAGVTASGHAEGVGLAIPATLVNQVVAALSGKASLAQGWLGIDGHSVTPALEARYGLRTEHGVLIATVTEQGPAAAAGVRAGDVIIGFNGIKIEDVSQLQRLIAEAQPAQQVDLLLARGSEQLALQLHAVPRRPEPLRTTDAPPASQAHSAPELSGLEHARPPPLDCLDPEPGC